MSWRNHCIRGFGLLWASLTLVAPAGCSGSGSAPVAIEELLGDAPVNGKRQRLDQEYRERVAGFNQRTKARLISAAELDGMLQRGEPVLLLDVREHAEHAVSALPGARLVPPSEVAQAVLDVPPGAAVVTYCTAGYRSGLAAVELEKRLGRPVHNLDGGIIEWFNGGGEVRDPEGRVADRIHPYGEEWAKYVHRREPAPPSNSNAR